MRHFFDKTFKSMDSVFKSMDGVFDNMREEMKLAFSGGDGDLQITAQNGDVIISGKIRTLVINGYRIKLPEKVTNAAKTNDVSGSDKKSR